MPKDSGVNGDARRPSQLQVSEDQPPPYSRHTAHVDHATGAAGFGAREQQRPHAIPQTAPPSQHDTESLLRHADDHGSQLFQLSRAAQRYLRHYSKANLALEQVLLMRSQIIHVRNHGYNQRLFVTESQDAFLQEAEAILQWLPPEAPLEKLQTLHDQVQRDHERRGQHVQKTQEIEIEMSEKEYKLQKKVLLLAEDAKRLSEIVDALELNSIAVEELSAASTVTEAEREVKIPGLVQHYFEKLGDVGLEQERIINLEIDHRDSRVDRMNKYDQGRPPSMTDEEFENAFLRGMADAQAVYDEAVRKADLARAVCIGEGLNPDDYRKPPSETEKHNSQGAATDAAAASDTRSDGKDVLGEVQEPTYAPVYEQLALDPDSSMYPAWPRASADVTSPAEERVHTWLEDQILPDPWEHLESRRRSLSEARQAVLDIKTHDDGSVDVSERSSQSRKQQRHRDMPPFVRRLVDGDDGEERPVLLKRSSSESELFVLPLQQNDREETFSGLRGFTVQLP